MRSWPHQIDAPARDAALSRARRATASEVLPRTRPPRRNRPPLLWIGPTESAGRLQSGELQVPPPQRRPGRLTGPATLATVSTIPPPGVIVARPRIETNPRACRNSQENQTRAQGNRVVRVSRPGAWALLGSMSAAVGPANRRAGTRNRSAIFRLKISVTFSISLLRRGL